MSCPTRERRASRGSPPRNHRLQLLTAQDFTYNSFISSVFARIPAIFMKTSNLGDGGGVSNHSHVPFREDRLPPPAIGEGPNGSATGMP